jgi:hypothetical protein
VRYLVLAALLAVVAAACGGGDEAQSPPTATEAATTAAATTEADDATYEECEAAVGDLLDSLRELDSRLDVGMNYEEYNNRLGDVSVAYDRSVDNLQSLQSEQCLDVGTEAEDAFNAYIKASNIWDKCFDDIDCSTESIEAKLQNQWAKATLMLEAASARLDAMER